MENLKKIKRNNIPVILLNEDHSGLMLHNPDVCKQAKEVAKILAPLISEVSFLGSGSRDLDSLAKSLGKEVIIISDGEPSIPKFSPKDFLGKPTIIKK